MARKLVAFIWVERSEEVVLGRFSAGVVVVSVPTLSSFVLGSLEAAVVGFSSVQIDVPDLLVRVLVAQSRA